MLEIIEKKSDLESTLHIAISHSCWTKFDPPLEENGKIRMEVIESQLKAVLGQVHKITRVAMKTKNEEILNILRESISCKHFSW